MRLYDIMKRVARVEREREREIVLGIRIHGFFMFT
jgi:hypothetical protein